MFTRYRMRRIIRLLEEEECDQIISLCSRPKYLRAFLALESGNYLRGVYADGSRRPLAVFPGKSGPLYFIERSELWKNRIGGFVCGVLTSALAAWLASILTSVF